MSDDDCARARKYGIIGRQRDYTDDEVKALDELFVRAPMVPPDHWSKGTASKSDESSGNAVIDLWVTLVNVDGTAAELKQRDRSIARLHKEIKLGSHVVRVLQPVLSV